MSRQSSSSLASLVIVVSAVLVLLCRQTHTDTQTDVDEHFTPATLVGVSNYSIMLCISEYIVSLFIKPKQQRSRPKPTFNIFSTPSLKVVSSPRLFCLFKAENAVKKHFDIVSDYKRK